MAAHGWRASGRSSIMQQIETLTDASDQGGRGSRPGAVHPTDAHQPRILRSSPSGPAGPAGQGLQTDQRRTRQLEAVTKAHAEAEARVKELESKWREAELAKSPRRPSGRWSGKHAPGKSGKLREQAGTARSERDAALREASQTSKASERLQTELTATQKALADAKQARTHARTERISTARQKLATERQEILAKIRALGYRANAGFDPTFYYHLGRLAINYVHEGVLTLDEVVAKGPRARSRCDRPGCVQALNARDPKRQARARSDAQKRGAGSCGHRPGYWPRSAGHRRGCSTALKAKPPASQQIRALRSQLTQLSGAGVQGDRRRDQAGAGGTPHHRDSEPPGQRHSPGSGSQEGQHDAGRTPAGRQKIRDLKSLMRATDQIASLRQQIQSGEFVIPETRPFERCPRLDQARIELRKARSAVRQAIEEQRPWTTRRGLPRA